jgi:uncharacterized protein
MQINSQDFFFIPYHEKYIIYSPVNGVIVLGNLQLVNDLKKILREKEKSYYKKTSRSSRRKHDDLVMPLQAKENFTPHSISYILTDQCTLHCRYCYANGGSGKMILDRSVFIKSAVEICRNIISAGSDQFHVSFHGGDIGACWEYFVECCSLLKKLSEKHRLELKISVGINGVLKDDQRDFIVRNCRSATVSFDGTPDLQNMLRPFSNGKESFAYVDKTLKYFDSHRFSYSLRSTITNESVDKMEEAIAFICKNYSVKTIMFEPLFPSGRAQTNKIQPPDSLEFIDNFRKAQDIAEKNQRELIYSGTRVEVLTSTFCRAVTDSCVITPDGNISSCYEVIHKDDPFSKIFLYGKYNKSRAGMIINKRKRRRLTGLTVHAHAKCRNCFCKYHCAGDCPLKTLAVLQYDGDPGLDRCYITRELTKDQLIKRLNLAGAETKD